MAGTRTPEAARFLRDFIEHCLRGTNHATGKVGAPLDFLAFHAKGSPRIVDGHVRMGIATQLQDIDRGFEVVAGFPELKGRPIVIGESDPDGCAACPATVFPQNAYRNGSLYASYTAAAYARTLDLAEKHAVNAFEAWKRMGSPSSRRPTSTLSPAGRLFWRCWIPRNGCGPSGEC